MAQGLKEKEKENNNIEVLSEHLQTAYHIKKFRGLVFINLGGVNTWSQPPMKIPVFKVKTMVSHSKLKDGRVGDNTQARTTTCLSEIASRPVCRRSLPLLKFTVQPFFFPKKPWPG